MAPLPRTRFDAVEWESRKADKEGVVAVDGHRYLAGPSWRGWRLEVGLRAFDVEIRTGGGQEGRGPAPRVRRGVRHGPRPGGGPAGVGAHDPRVGREPDPR